MQEVKRRRGKKKELSFDTRKSFNVETDSDKAKELDTLLNNMSLTYKARHGQAGTRRSDSCDDGTCYYHTGV